MPFSRNTARAIRTAPTKPFTGFACLPSSSRRWRWCSPFQPAPSQGLIPPPEGLLLNWASLALLLTTLWYLKMSVSLAIGMVAVSVAMLAACVWVQGIVPYPLWQTAIVIFVVAWIGQFIGHKIEGKKPSFFKDLQFLLVGPMWLMHFIYKRVGIAY